MHKFDYDDIVRVESKLENHPRQGQKAWVVGVFEKSLGPYFDKFPQGTVYTIEYDDGESIEVAEDNLVLYDD